MTGRLKLLLSGLIGTLLAGCGAGTAGIIAGAGDNGGGGTTPAITSFSVPNPKVSPAGLTLEASAAIGTELFYAVGGGPDRAMQLLPGPGISGNSIQLAAGPNDATWDFAADLGTGLTRDVTLRAKRGGALVEGGEVQLFGVGNDAPVVLSVEPLPSDPNEPDESSGIVELLIVTRDSSTDLVDLTVQWRRASGPADAWTAATFAGAPPGGVETSETGRAHSFFWNTNIDLADDEDAVLLRVTAHDRTVPGLPFETSSPFRIDNNEEPIVQLENDLVISNPDERRGIPIPFRVIDEEGDLVDVIFQWRHEDEEFPSLDQDGNGNVESAEVDEILADPVLRQGHHVCTPYPRFAHGLIVPIDETTVRLPELARGESWILAAGIVGKTLELLRPSIAAPITQTWSSNPLVSPIAALPVGDGLTALVLDVPGQGRLREVELATGAVVREVATLGQGIPSAMTFERREKAVLVALDDSGTWRIERVELASGAVSELVVSDGAEPAPLRGIASLGTHALVFTAGSSLFHLDYSDGLAPQLGTLLADLAAPWGVAVDPLQPDRVYVSERDADRVLAIALDSHGKLPVVVKTADLQPGTLAAPEALALEHHGARLLVVTSARGGGRELTGLDLGAAGGNRSFPIGTTVTDFASVASGPDGLRLLCLPASSELLAAGGLEQRRTITARSSTSQDTTVERAFSPVPAPVQPWRVREQILPLQASDQGVAGSFVWDSSDAEGSLFVRATARDAETGTPSDGAAAKHVRWALDVDSILLGGLGTTDQPRSVAVADLDGDGDQDLVSANLGSNDLTVFLQVSPGSFSSAPIVLGGSGTTDAPRSVAVADLDGDGDQDIVSANTSGDDLTVFFQLSPGNFADAPLVLGSRFRTDGPQSLAVADFDGDGDQDIVSADTGDPFTGGASDLVVFFQLSPGTFARNPLRLGGRGTTNGPAAVAAADLDGDGDQDIVSANGLIGGGNLTVFFQLSPGRFATPPLVIGAANFTSVAAADLDGDGDLDLAAKASNSSNLQVFFQLSSGRFLADPLVLGGFPTANGLQVAATDLDGDGDQDLVSANTGSLTVFLQLFPGSFSDVPLVLDRFGVDFMTAVAAADLDGDGDQDLVSANETDADLEILLQFSPGSFDSAGLAMGGVAMTDQPYSVAVADLDGDGDQDLASANLGSSNLTVFFQPSPGSFQAAPLVVGGFGTSASPLSVAAGDFDGDGDQDLVSANVDSSNLTVFLQVSPGSFSGDPLVLGGPETTISPFGVSAADLDGDGDQDLVSANLGGNDLTVFFQLSPASFATAPLVLGGPGTIDSPVSVVPADLDGDGDEDLASANLNGNNLSIFLQHSPGSFASAPLVVGGPGTTDGPYSIAAADLDGDGDQDLVSANSGGNNLTVFLQLSPGSFASAPLVLGELGATHLPLSVAAGDLDGDGDQDLVSANSGGNNLAVFLQRSAGSFAAPFHLDGLGTLRDPESVAVADLDGDGDQDLVSANNSGRNLTVFFGGR